MMADTGIGDVITEDQCRAALLVVAGWMNQEERGSLAFVIPDESGFPLIGVFAAADVGLIRDMEDLVEGFDGG